MVAERVVDLLEPVQVHEQHRDVLAMALGSRQRLTHSVVEEDAVGQAGERVVERLVPKPIDEATVVQRHTGVVGDRLEQTSVLVIEGAHVTQPIGHAQETDHAVIAVERCDEAVPPPTP